MGALGFAIEPGRFRVAGGGAPPAAAFDFTGGALPAGATLTRGSPATYRNASGTLVTAASNVARFEYDPATLGLRGLLIEPAATNKLQRSAALDAAPWLVFGNLTVTADQATAPDGTPSAERLVLESGAAQLYQNYAGGADVHSIWLRGAAGGETLSIIPANGGGFGTAKTVVLTTAWVRHEIAASISPTEYFLLSRNNGVAGEASGTTAITVHAWGAQAETGTKATSHVATAGGSGSRSADALTLAWGTLGIGDGPVTVRYTFDDLSTQDVATTVAGGSAIVPTTLARRHLRRAERIGA